MRFDDLKGLSYGEIINFIKNSPEVEMKNALENPKNFARKVLVFEGNYDGFDTNRICVRIFEYIPKLLLILKNLPLLVADFL